MLVGDGGQLRGRPETTEVTLGLSGDPPLRHLVVVALENDLLPHKICKVTHTLVDPDLPLFTECHIRLTWVITTLFHLRQRACYLVGAVTSP